MARGVDGFDAQSGAAEPTVVDGRPPQSDELGGDRVEGAFLCDCAHEGLKCRPEVVAPGWKCRAVGDVVEMGER